MIDPKTVSVVSASVLEQVKKTTDIYFLKNWM